MCLKKGTKDIWIENKRGNILTEFLNHQNTRPAAPRRDCIGLNVSCVAVLKK
jgi:hypothetical protein